LTTWSLPATTLRAAATRFDYWRDPHGFKLEHWTDGDRVNAQTPQGRFPVGDGGPGAVSQWGPMPEDFPKAYPETLSIGPLDD